MASKRISLTPTKEARKLIDEAVAVLTKQGSRTNPSSFCTEAAVEKALKIIKENRQMVPIFSNMF